MRRPVGLLEDVVTLSYEDRRKLTAFGSISIRAIEEARWLGQRTDGATATAPYHNTTARIAHAYYENAELDNEVMRSLREWVLQGSVEEILAQIIEGSRNLPGDLESDQIEDWIIARALERHNNRANLEGVNHD